MAPAVGDVVAPAEELGVDIVEVAEGACGEEGVAQVLDLALDLPLLVSASRGAGVGREVIVAGELEQAGMKLHRGAAAVEHGAAEIVVDEVAGDAAQARRRRRRVRGGSFRASGRG